MIIQGAALCSTFGSMGLSCSRADEHNERGVISDLSLFGLGKVPDGEVINAALKFAASRGKGGVVRLVSKPLWLASGIQVPADTTLDGLKDAVIRRPPLGDYGDIIGIGSRSTIRGLRVDGAKMEQTKPAYGVFGFRVTDALIEDVEVSDCFGIGCGMAEARSITHRRVKVTGSGHGLQGFWNDSYTSGYERGDHQYENCTAIANDLDGLSIGQHGCTVLGGTYNGNGLKTLPENLGAAGIYGTPHSLEDLTIIGPEVAENTAFGIEVQMVRGKILEADVRCNSLAGIYVRPGSSDSEIKLNRCHNNGLSRSTANPEVWGKAGIQLDQVSSIRVVGNRCFDDRPEAGRTQTFGLQLMRRGRSRDVWIIGNNFSANKFASDNIDPARSPEIRHFLQGLVYTDNR